MPDLPTRTLPAIAAAALLSHAHAQPAAQPPAPPAPPAQPQPAASPSSTTLSEYVARSVARAALMDLRSTLAPSARDFRIACILLGIAHDLLPQDTELLRRLIEASNSAGDKQGVIDATRALLKLDPADTRAQLRLLTESILARNQTAEDRLAAYETCLTGPRAQAFDPSVRSRLALDAALLLRDAGDMKGFVQKLTLATQLDPTHKEAHALAATVFAEERPADTVGRLQMLEHLLMADPLDPNVHLSIARELAAGRAFDAATRFHNNAAAILQAAAAPTDRAGLEATVLRWYTDGPGAVAAQLNQDLTAARGRARDEINRRQAAGQPTRNLRQPEDIRRTPSFETLYVMAVHASGDQAATQAAVGDVVTFASGALQGIDEALRAGQIKPEQAERAKLELALQVQTLRVWTGVQVPEAKRDLAETAALREQYPEPVAVLEAWAALRTGDPQGAIDRLRPYAETNMLAGLGIGMAHEMLGQPSLAAEQYDRVLRLSPLEITGAWARSRLLALGFQDDAAESERLRRAVADIPAEIGAGMVSDPRRFVQLTLRLPNPTPEGIDRTPLRITLENLGPYPLALGPDRALSSRFVLMPRTENFKLGELRLTQAEVVDLDRRLRLMPREKLEAEVWPDAGPSGWLLECLANRSVVARWRVIQGFVNDPQSGLRPGPMCVAAETEAAIRRPVAEARLTPELMARKVAGDPPESLLRLAAGVRALIMQPMLVPELGEVPATPAAGGNPSAPPPEASPEALRAIGQAFADRYPTLSPINRALLAAVVPHSRLAPGMAPLDQAIASDGDPTVLCIALATRVADAADPVLARAKLSDDPRVKEMAGLVEARLAGTDPIFARLSRETLNHRAPAPGEGK